MREESSLLLILLLILTIRAVDGGRCPYECLCDLETKTADCSERFKRYPPHDLNNVFTSLMLQNNYLGDLTIQYFKHFNLTHLTRLDISNNLIAIIHGNAFSDMNKLNYLKMENNKIYFLVGDSFVGLTNLENLYLDNNLLGTLYEGFFHDLSKVKVLSLRNNRVEYIQPKSFRGMYQLKLLNLSGNCLKNLENGFLQGIETNLEALALNNNSLEIIEPGAFKGMSKLVFLSLGNNAMEEVKGYYFEGLTSLEYLYLNDNMIEIVRIDSFQMLPNLKYLDMIENYIYYVNPEAFVSNKKLRWLYLSHNEALHLQSEFPFINSLSLEMLKLSGCRVRELTLEEFSKTPNLIALALDDTYMSTVNIEALEQMKKLKYLSLQDNPLSCNCNLQNVRKWCQDHGINTSWLTEDVGFKTYERYYEPSCYIPERDIVINWQFLICNKTQN